MINEVKLIDANALRLMKVAECAGHTIEFATGWKACVEYCKNDAPAIEAEPVNGWISVKDRPPEDDVDVILHDKYCGTLIGWYDKKDDVFKTDYISQLEAVTRWIPLPEDPKEE